MYASILLRDLQVSMGDMDIAAARIIAGYIVHKVKEYVDGCGMMTNIIHLSNGRAAISSDEEIEAMEGLFSGYAWLEKVLLDYILCRSENPGREVTRQIRGLRRLAEALLSTHKVQ
jgi:hypothetical protein